uniref:25S rRNA (uridine-N(3))-methyltransferase BMT5-like domain-containing protein n=1 Tax=Oryza punctata TaxID=4537 RepID=A0A0E0M2I7_ORYPU
MAVASPGVGHAAAAVACGEKAGPVEVSMVGVGEKGTGTLDGASPISAEEEEEVEEEEEAEEEEEEEEQEEEEEEEEEEGEEEEEMEEEEETKEEGEEDVGDEEDEEGVKWLKHYSSMQSILVIGDGDFSFSRSLATAFCSGENLVSTSLDSYETLRAKYAKAESNIMILKKMGATTLHGVDAKTMKHHTDLKMRRFDRIVFNFPHAGFKGNGENDVRLIKLHKDLVRGFFHNARHLLRPSGEIHVSHKEGSAYGKWNIEQLASKSSLILVEKVDFHIEDYPGYKNKRGDGPRCDKPFHLGRCNTFKFSIRNLKKQKKGHSNLICSIPSLGSSHIHPEMLASDWSPSQLFRPVNAVNMPVTSNPPSLRIAQRHQPGFPVNFLGLHTAAACSLQQGNIYPMLSIVRPSPHLLPVVGSIAPPMCRITSTSLFEPQEQPKPVPRPSQSVSSYDFAREHQMNLRREFEMRRRMMPAGTSLDYFTFLEYRFRDPAEKEKWLQTMITLHATRW